MFPDSSNYIYEYNGIITDSYNGKNYKNNSQLSL